MRNNMQIGGSVAQVVWIGFLFFLVFDSFCHNQQPVSKLKTTALSRSLFIRLYRRNVSTLIDDWTWSIQSICVCMRSLLAY